MKTNRLFITVMMAAIFSCGNMLAQNAQAPNQKKKLTPEQRQEMQINRMQKSLMLDDETAETEKSGRNQTNVSGQVRKDSECPPAGEIICCTSSQQTYASRSLCTPVQ